jgi:hypothetical protein
MPPALSLDTAPREAVSAVDAPYPAVARASQAASQAAPHVGPIAPSIDYGDTELLAIPRDAPGRLVLIVALVLAADLQAPWIAFDGTHVAPSHFTALMLLVTGLLLAAAASVIYSPLRARAYFAAYPLVLGAASFGATAVLALLAGPLASPLMATFVAHVMADPAIDRNLANPISSPPTLALAADTGLYVFLIGTLILGVAGYQILVNAVAAAAPPHSIAAAPVAGRPAQSGADGGTIHGARPHEEATAGVPPATVPGPSSRGPESGPSTRGPTRTSVVLPGSDGWNQAPEAPPVGRNAPSPRGMQGGLR